MTEILFSSIAFILFHLLTHPKSSIRKRAPLFRIKKLEIYPCFRLHLQSRVIHIHHWIFCSVILLISIPTHFRILDASAVQGFIFGAITQGLFTNKKALRFIYKTPLEVSDEYR